MVNNKAVTCRVPRNLIETAKQYAKEKDISVAQAFRELNDIILKKRCGLR